MLNEINNRIDQLKAGERFCITAVPDSIYHASKGIGSTLMGEAFQSMAHYHAAITKEYSPSSDMLIGSAVHAALLEIELFNNKVVEMPKGMARGKSANYLRFCEKYPYHIHLKPCEMALVGAMTEAVLLQAPQCFEGGEAEKSYWYKDETGLILKARIDYEIDDCGVDLKTTRHEDKAAFERRVVSDYGVQDSLYRRVTGLADFIFVGVSKAAPHQCFGAKQSADVRSYYDGQLSAVIKQIIFSHELESFAFPPFEIKETTLPTWVKNRAIS